MRVSFPTNSFSKRSLANYFRSTAFFEVCEASLICFLGSIFFLVEEFTITPYEPFSIWTLIFCILFADHYTLRNFWSIFNTVLLTLVSIGYSFLTYSVISIENDVAELCALIFSLLLFIVVFSYLMVRSPKMNLPCLVSMLVQVNMIPALNQISLGILELSTEELFLSMLLNTSTACLLSMLPCLVKGYVFKPPDFERLVDTILKDTKSHLIEFNTLMKDYPNEYRFGCDENDTIGDSNAHHEDRYTSLPVDVASIIGEQQLRTRLNFNIGDDIASTKGTDYSSSNEIPETIELEKINLHKLPEDICAKTKGLQRKIEALLSNSCPQLTSTLLSHRLRFEMRFIRQAATLTKMQCSLEKILRKISKLLDVLVNFLVWKNLNSSRAEIELVIDECIAVLDSCLLDDNDSKPTLIDLLTSTLSLGMRSNHQSTKNKTVATSSSPTNNDNELPEVIECDVGDFPLCDDDDKKTSTSTANDHLNPHNRETPHPGALPQTETTVNDKKEERSQYKSVDLVTWQFLKDIFFNIANNIRKHSVNRIDNEFATSVFAVQLRELVKSCDELSKDFRHLRKVHNALPKRRQLKIILSDILIDSHPFPYDIRHLLHVKSSRNIVEKWYRHFIKVLASSEMKFAIKLAIAIVLSLLPCMLRTSAGTDFCTTWNWKWVTITLLVLMNSPIVGSGIAKSILRIAGTLIGGFVAASVVQISDNIVYLSVATFVFLFPCLHVKLNTKYSYSGVIMAVTYGLVLYLSITDLDTSPYLVMGLRMLTVVIGVLVALSINTFIWPYVARQELKIHLGSVLRQSSMLYQKALDPLIEQSTQVHVKTLEKELHKNHASILNSLSYERSLFVFATKEFGVLHGNFKKREFGNILDSVNKFIGCLEFIVLYCIHMDFGQDKMWAKAINAQSHNKLRRELCAAVVGILHICSSSIITGIPLPKYINFPSALAQQSLILNSAKSFFPDDHDIWKPGNNDKLILYTAYISNTIKTTMVLDELVSNIKELVGIYPISE